VLVGVGDRVDATLSSDPNTGYTWMPVRDESALIQHTGRTFQRTALGGQGAQTLSFIASRPGNSTLLLLYARPQEGDAAPRRVYTLIIEAVRTWNDAGTADHSRAIATTAGFLDSGASAH
jgi:predicted secreted protein